VSDSIHTWNYRVMKKELTGDFGYTDVEYAIYEVHYKDGKVTAYSSEPISPMGETPEELREDLKRMMMALERPLFDFEKEKA
jgi:hypothetical protein